MSRATSGAAMELPVIRIIIIGDGGVGKTCLLVRYAQDTFDTEHVPTVLTKYQVSQHHNGREYQIHLIDTAGQEEFKRIAEQHYGQVDVFLVCYSVDHRASLRNVPKSWVKAIPKREDGTKPPIILVGTKLDLRGQEGNASGEVPVSTKDGETMCREINAQTLIECSAKERANIDKVFYAAIEAHLNPNNGGSNCCVMS